MKPSLLEDDTYFLFNSKKDITPARPYVHKRHTPHFFVNFPTQLQKLPFHWTLKDSIQYLIYFVVSAGRPYSLLLFALNSKAGFTRNVSYARKRCGCGRCSVRPFKLHAREATIAVARTTSRGSSTAWAVAGFQQGGLASHHCGQCSATDFDNWHFEGCVSLKLHMLCCTLISKQ